MELFDRMNRIKAFALDVDGVLTDSLVHVWENGDQTRTMNVRDGFALKRAVDNGYQVVIITGGNSQGVVKRLNGLGITDIFLSVKNKVSALQTFAAKNNLSLEEIAYMGDDVIDHSVMQMVGLSSAPADAIPEILAISKFISSKDGGRGCVRDLIEQTMKIQGTWALSHEGEKPGV